MNGGTEFNTLQSINAWVSLGTSIACLLFIVAYAVLARWWRTYEGKIMMSKAVAIMLLALYTFLVVKITPESTALRWGRVAVVGVIGVFMVAQTVVLARRQLIRRQGNQSKEGAA